MNKSFRWNKHLTDGIFFLLLGGAMLIHSIQSYTKAFNQDITQSPYLFPGVLAIFSIILAISLLVQGVKEGLSANSTQEESKKDKSGNLLGVLVIAAMAIPYYAFMVLRPLPQITFSSPILSLTIGNFEVASMLFLLAMLFYLGIRKIPVLVLVSVLTPIVMSICFRTFLHVLLP